MLPYHGFGIKEVHLGECMAEQSSPLTMFFLITKAKNTTRWNGHAFIDRSFHKLGLLAVNLFDDLRITVGHLIRTNTYRWTMFSVKLMYGCCSMASQIQVD